MPRPRKKSTAPKPVEVKEEVKTVVDTMEKASEPVEKKTTSRKQNSKTASKKIAAVPETPVAEETPVVKEAPVVEETPATPVKKESTPRKTTKKPATEKKTATKKTASKATEKKSASTEKKTTVKKTDVNASKSVNVFFQYNGRESAELVDKAVEISGITSPKSINIYIKPEDNTVYYVIDDIAGSFEL